MSKGKRSQGARRLNDTLSFEFGRVTFLSCTKVRFVAISELAVAAE